MKHHFYLILAMVIVGSSVAAGKFVTQNLPINLSMFFRFLIAVSALFLFARFKGVKICRLGIREFFIIGLQALFGSVLFNVFLLNGLKTIPAVSSGILTGTTPVMVAVLSVIFLGERFSIFRVIAILTAMIGVILIKGSVGGSGLSFSVGFLLVMGAVFVESCFLIMRKKLRDDLDSFSLSFYLSVFGMLFFAPFGLVEVGGLNFGAISVSEYVAILYYGLFITVAAYLLWMEGIKHVDAMIASVYTAVMPLSAVATSCLFLGESINMMQMGGFALILLSLGMVIFKR